MLDAIADGRTDLVWDWIEQGGAPDVEHRGASLARWCAYYGDVSALKLLARHGVPLETLGDNLDLSGAAFHGHWRLCQYLIEQGADVDHPLPDTGEVPLHAATCGGHPRFERVLRVLLAAGADPGRRTHPGAETGCFARDVRTRGETPLHRAAAFGSEAMVRALLAAGADPAARDAHGDTPLSLASWHGRPAHVVDALCYAEFRVHPLAVERSRSRPPAVSGMEENLLGEPHVE